MRKGADIRENNERTEDGKGIHHETWEKEIAKQNNKIRDAGEMTNEQNKQ